MNKFITMLLCFLCLTNVYAEESNTQTSKPYSEENRNIVVTQQGSHDFTIVLKSNATTGYGWFLREYNHALIEPVKHQYVTQKKALMGAPGEEVWTFQVKRDAFIVPMQTVLRFTYTRPFQSSESGNQVTFHVTTMSENK